MWHCDAYAWQLTCSGIGRTEASTSLFCNLRRRLIIMADDSRLLHFPSYCVDCYWIILRFGFSVFILFLFFFLSLRKIILHLSNFFFPPLSFAQEEIPIEGAIQLSKVQKVLIAVQVNGCILYVCRDLYSRNKACAASLNRQYPQPECNMFTR